VCRCSVYITIIMYACILRGCVYTTTMEYVYCMHCIPSSLRSSSRWCACRGCALSTRVLGIITRDAPYGVCIRRDHLSPPLCTQCAERGWGLPPRSLRTRSAPRSAAQCVVRACMRVLRTLSLSEYTESTLACTLLSPRRDGRGPLRWSSTAWALSLPEALSPSGRPAGGLVLRTSRGLRPLSRAFGPPYRGPSCGAFWGLGSGRSRTSCYYNTRARA